MICEVFRDLERDLGGVGVLTDRELERDDVIQILDAYQREQLLGGHEPDVQVRALCHLISE